MFFSSRLKKRKREKENKRDWWIRWVGFEWFVEGAETGLVFFRLESGVAKNVPKGGAKEICTKLLPC